MNTYERKTVVQISEQLHICLVKAIDTALSERFGEGWFSGFCEFDYAQDIPVLDKSHTSVSRMDFQACLKFLRYREDYAKIVFEYYGHNFYFDTDDAKKAQRLLNQRLENLIHNVRNFLFAHASATMVEAGRDDSMRYSVYGADEAVSDMLKLASFFEKATDEKGISYYDKMKKISKLSEYLISEVIKKENLKTSVGTFVVACRDNNIRISTDETGEIFLFSSDYEDDLKKIKSYLKAKNKKKKIRLILVVIATLMCLVCVVVLGVKVFVFDNNANDLPDYAYANEVTLVINETYWDGDNIVAEGSIYNGFDYTIEHINVQSISLEDVDGVFAEASFGELQGVALEGYSSIDWTFVFDEACVLRDYADLSEVWCSSTLSYGNSSN